MIMQFLWLSSVYYFEGLITLRKCLKNQACDDNDNSNNCGEQYLLNIITL